MQALIGLTAALLLLGAPKVPEQFGAGATHPLMADTPGWIEPVPEPKKHHPEDRKHWHVIPYYVGQADTGTDTAPATPPAETAPPAQTPPVVSPPEAAAPVEQIPPDAQGPLTVAVVPGAKAQPPRWEVGKPLPSNLPRVTLEWSHYGLPKPDAGMLYVRVGRDVLLVSAKTRVVEKLMEPQ